MKYRLLLDHKASVTMPKPWYRVEELVNGQWTFVISGYESTARQMFEHLIHGGRLDAEIVSEVDTVDRETIELAGAGHG
jgi:hypothetical protein